MQEKCQQELEEARAQRDKLEAPPSASEAPPTAPAAPSPPQPVPSIPMPAPATHPTIPTTVPAILASVPALLPAPARSAAKPAVVQQAESEPSVIVIDDSSCDPAAPPKAAAPPPRPASRWLRRPPTRFALEQESSSVVEIVDSDEEATDDITSPDKRPGERSGCRRYVCTAVLMKPKKENEFGDASGKLTAVGLVMLCQNVLAGHALWAANVVGRLTSCFGPIFVSPSVSCKATCAERCSLQRYALSCMWFVVCFVKSMKISSKSAGYYLPNAWQLISRLHAWQVPSIRLLLWWWIWRARGAWLPMWRWRRTSPALCEPLAPLTVNFVSWAANQDACRSAQKWCCAMYKERTDLLWCTRAQSSFVWIDVRAASVTKRCGSES